MKVVILAGGLGTRISEYTDSIPKPMVPIGGKPVLWHIMKYYSSFGFNDFVICLGYKGYVIKEYFFNYYKHNSDMKINLKSNEVEILNSNVEPWNISLIDTGQTTMTGGRLKLLQDHLSNDEDFFMTYGDGLSNVDIKKLLEFHKSHGGQVSMTAVTPPGRFGAIITGKKGQVEAFQEKVPGDGNLINGGFFVIKPEALNQIKDSQTPWETEPLEKITKEGQLYSFNHDGFWQCMDTKRDRDNLEEIWDTGDAPWKTW
jgi:glucose-1-phosphate cytidylyltransferase